jgi:hypothetical protein
MAASTSGLPASATSAIFSPVAGSGSGQERYEGLVVGCLAMDFERLAGLRGYPFAINVGLCLKERRIFKLQ